jgi:hypothetical protein
MADGINMIFRLMPTFLPQQLWCNNKVLYFWICIMFADLPMPIQQQILSYLATDNFKAAKALHDHFLLTKVKKDDRNNQYNQEDEEDHG